MNAKAILDRTPPPQLYHYTGQRGLLGIIESRELWASHTQYLNDSQEFTHAVDAMKHELHCMRGEPQYNDKHSSIEELSKALHDGIESINVCVCSFSENRDQLSQWRAYSGPSGGYSIGFSGNFLRAVALRQGLWLAPCLYLESEQRTLIRTLLHDVMHENERHERAATHDESPPGGNLLAYLNRYAPIIKHDSFSEENEWRLISPPVACGNQQFSYRVGVSMLIPYYRIPISSNGLNLRVDSVVVGPCPHEAQSVASVRGLLLRHGLPDTEVVPSATPFRSW